NNVSGGVDVTVNFSAPGYLFDPSKLAYPIICGNKTQNVCAYSSDCFGPTVSLESSPDTVISTNSVTFEWTAEDDVSPTNMLEYQYSLTTQGTSSWTMDTTVTYNDLKNGVYSFEVKSRDEQDNVGGTPAKFTFVINAEPYASSVVLTRRGVWSSRLTLKMPSNPTAESRTFILLPEHSGHLVEELIPTRIHYEKSSSAFGVNDLLDDYSNLDPIITSADIGYKLTIPLTDSTVLMSNSEIIYDIEWGKISYLGWDEAIDVPSGVNPRAHYLDENFRIFRCQEKTQGTNCARNSTMYYDVASKDAVLIQADVIKAIQGNCIWGHPDGVHHRHRPEQFIPYNGGHIMIYLHERNVTAPGSTPDTAYRGYGVVYFDDVGTVTYFYESPLTESTFFTFSKRFINGGYWVIVNEQNNEDSWIDIIDEHGNLLMPRFSLHSNYTNGHSYYRPVPVGDNVIIIWYE
ncbi:MAG: hypothetical protein IH946_02525, partial [Bacteroidetes bacterium]|nr:hypothetical protein [Bacteroidota bacterium]